MTLPASPQNEIPPIEESAAEPQAPGPDVRREAIAALLTAIASLAFLKVATRLPGNIGVVLVSTMINLLILLHFTVRTARALGSRAALALNLVVSAILALPAILVPIAHRLAPEWPGWVAAIPRYRAYQEVVFSVQGVHELVLVWFAVSLGVLVSRMVREFKLLLPIAVALACVDLYVVFGGGLVTQAKAGPQSVASAAMTALTVQMPTLRPTSTGAAPMPPAVGFADFLFIALFFASFARFGVPSRRSFAVLCVVLALYMSVLFILPGVDLPALVPIAVVVIGMNLRRFKFARDEAFALLYAALIGIPILGFMIYRSHRQ